MICGRCYATRADVIAHFGSICYMAGVIAICGRCCYHLFRIYCIWLMLLPYVYGRCYANRAGVIAHLGSICSMAGVIAIKLWQMLLPLVLIILNVADAIAICVWQMLLPLGWCYCLFYLYFWLMLLPWSGRCYNHCLNVLADGIAKWQMEWPL